jgi:hypothetical protein
MKECDNNKIHISSNLIFSIILSAEGRDVTQLHIFPLVLSLWAMLTSRRLVDLSDYTEARRMG